MEAAVAAAHVAEGRKRLGANAENAIFAAAAVAVASVRQFVVFSSGSLFVVRYQVSRAVLDKTCAKVGYRRSVLSDAFSVLTLAGKLPTRPETAILVDGRGGCVFVSLVGRQMATASARLAGLADISVPKLRVEGRAVVVTRPAAERLPAPVSVHREDACRRSAKTSEPRF